MSGEAYKWKSRNKEHAGGAQYKPAATGSAGTLARPWVSNTEAKGLTEAMPGYSIRQTQASSSVSRIGTKKDVEQYITMNVYVHTILYMKCRTTCAVVPLVLCVHLRRPWARSGRLAAWRTCQPFGQHLQVTAQ